MVKLGWKAGPEQFAPRDLLEWAAVAENAGFQTIDVSDHFNPWSEAGQACFSWTWLGGVAATTKKIEMGTGVTCPILRYHPSIIAQAAATLAALAPNRVYLAVGTGEALNEYASTGFWPGYDERQAMLGEAIDLIRQLWTGQETSFDGTYFQTKKARLFTRPAQPPPIYVSALVPESAYFAGQHGDGLMTVGGEKPEVYQQIIERFEEGARAAGRDPKTMPRLIELSVAYAQDEQGALQALKHYWAGAMVPALFDQKIYTPAMSAKNGAVVGDDTFHQKMCISGKVEDHVKYAQQYIGLGFDTLFFHSADPDQRTFLERFGREVLPQIHSASRQQTQQRQPAGAR